MHIFNSVTKAMEEILHYKMHPGPRYGTRTHLSDSGLLEAQGSKVNATFQYGSTTQQRGSMPTLKYPYAQRQS